MEIIEQLLFINCLKFYIKVTLLLLTIENYYHTLEKNNGVIFERGSDDKT